MQLFRILSTPEAGFRCLTRGAEARSIGTMPPASTLRRDQSTLVFDGDCGFCTSAVRWLEGTLPAPPPSHPYQLANLEELGLTAQEAADMVWLVATDRRGSLRQYGGYLAVSTLLRHQPAWGWRFLGVLMDTLPFSLVADAVYRVVARFRYVLPGGTPACRVDREG